MLKIGDYVVKVNEGICKVEESVQRDDGTEMRNYFLLVPISNSGMNIYIPQNSEYSGVRALLSKEEAQTFIDTIEQIKPREIDNDKQREQIYKDALKSLELSQLVSVLRNMDARAVERKKIGKKVTALDERYQKLMEDALLQELAFVLGRERGELLTYIVKKF